MCCCDLNSVLWLHPERSDFLKNDSILAAFVFFAKNQTFMISCVVMLFCYLQWKAIVHFTLAASVFLPETRPCLMVFCDVRRLFDECILLCINHMLATCIFLPETRCFWCPGAGGWCFAMFLWQEQWILLCIYMVISIVVIKHLTSWKIQK